MSLVTYPFSHGVDRKAPRGTYVVRRVATLELEHGTAKRRQLSTLPAHGNTPWTAPVGWKRGHGL